MFKQQASDLNSIVLKTRFPDYRLTANIETLENNLF
jgi:hypothetical protein